LGRKLQAAALIFCPHSANFAQPPLNGRFRSAIRRKLFHAFGFIPLICSRLKLKGSIGLNAPPLNIEIADQQQLPVDTNQLIEIASTILRDHGVIKGELSIALVDDPTIRELNLKYLDHDWETDVISFVLDEDDDSLTGQLIVSTDTATRVAAQIDSTAAAELALYVAHGTLHLVGFDDVTEELATEMQAAEKRYLQKFSIPCTNREA
jgi:probable rRNA maturation factor